MNNAAPTVTSVGLYELDNETTATNMDPTTEYAVKIEVTDTNTLDDLRNIYVVINESGYDGSNTVQKQANYTWTSTGGGTGTWALIGPTGTTWTLETSTESGGAADASSGTWYLHFKPAKTAEAGSWGINVTTKDQEVCSAEVSQTGRTMNFYSEIASFASSLDFGIVALGSTNKVELTSSVIANGNYVLESYSSTPWTDGTYNVAVVDSSPGANQIGLVNNATEDSGNSNAVSTTDTYTGIYGYTSGLTITADDGASKPVFVWLTLPATGIHATTYAGTYYYQIVNA